MKVLIAFGTTEGQTKKISEIVASQIGAKGHEVTVMDTSSPMGSVKPQNFDKIIVAGSVHQEGHQENVEFFVLGNLSTLQAKQTMFISVSLAAAFEAKRSDAEGYAARFLKDVGWKPDKTLLVAGAARQHDDYDYYQQQILSHVVLEGRDIEDPNQDQEFTDWEALAKSIDEFIDN